MHRMAKSIPDQLCRLDNPQEEHTGHRKVDCKVPARAFETASPIEKATRVIPVF